MRKALYLERSEVHQNNISISYSCLQLAKLRKDVIRSGEEPKQRRRRIKNTSLTLLASDKLE